jgi:hypothetical protein
VLDFSIEGLGFVKQLVLTGLDTFKDDVKQVVDRFVADLNDQKNPTLGAFSSEHDPSEEHVYQADHNVVMNAYKENHERAKLRSGGLLMEDPRLRSAIDDLVRKLEELANNFQFGDGKTAFSEAVEYFTNIGSEPDRALQLLMSGVIKTLEATALFVLDFARGVIATLMDLVADLVRVFRDVLFSEWEIPILSQIYKFFTGKALSIAIVDIMAYLVAIPGTLTFKLIANRAPFPDDQSVTAFEEFFTVAYLKAKFGIPLKRSERNCLRLAGDKDAKIVGLSFYSAGLFCRAFVDGYTALNSAKTGALGQAATSPGVMTGLAITLSYVTSAFTCPWLLNTDLGALECGAGRPGFVGYNWISQLVFGPSRAVAIAVLMDAGKPRVYTSEITASLWGVANTIMVVWNYCWSDPEKRDRLSLSRALTGGAPGMLRFMATPDINQRAKFIPVGTLIVIQAVSYLGSIGCAIASAVQASELLPACLAASVAEA